MLEDTLLEVNKPGRYIGEEWNMARKDTRRIEINFALCFPDLYEVGMSNLGLRILYGLLNSIPDIYCERFFAVDSDMEGILRNHRSEILSLESKRKARDFDIIGFSLAYELNYTNVLNILDLGSIPLEASLRDHTFPLVIGGGPCVLNPEPIADFFDLFVIGEAEEAILEIIDIYRESKGDFKASRMSKHDLLARLAQVEGVYVPSLYEAISDYQGRIIGFRPKDPAFPAKIRKRFVKDLDNAYFPVSWLIPYIQIVYDRITLEIMRGCPNTCRFCQASHLYFPFRRRKIESILDLASRIYRCTGYEELSLGGLSVSDYKDIEGLSRSLNVMFKDKAVSISLPSVKPCSLLGDLCSLIATVKKTSLTFAPEAGSERLRRILAKDFDMDSLFKVLDQAYSCGYRHVKLYFMIGLPGEERGDLDSIIELANSVSELGRKVNKKPVQVNISINTLIPKAHTSLQWLGMLGLEEIKYRQDYLRARAKNKRLKLSFHNCYMSFLEGVFSRGDRRLSRVILSAFRQGARFDGWEDRFRFEKWSAAFKESGIEPDFYLRAKAEGAFLPWDFLDTGVDKQILQRDFTNVISGLKSLREPPPQPK